MLLTFKDRGVDNDVPFVSFQKKYGEPIMSHTSLQGRKCRACVFIDHSLIKEKTQKKCSLNKSLDMIKFKYLTLETSKFDITNLWRLVGDSDIQSFI